MKRWIIRCLGRGLGPRGERVAARYLRRQGLRILARNVRFGRDEIDLVALDGETLVFVEVKSRSESSWSRDLEKIDRRKQRALRRACWRYLSAIDYRAVSYRVDGVSVEFVRGRWWLKVADVRWYEDILTLNPRG